MMIRYLLLLVDGRHRIEEFDSQTTSPEDAEHKICGATMELGCYSTRAEAEQARAEDITRTRLDSY